MSYYIGYIGSAFSSWWYQTPASAQNSEPPKDNNEECRETVCDPSIPVDKKQFENPKLAYLENRKTKGKRITLNRKALISREDSTAPTVGPQTYAAPTVTPRTYQKDISTLTPSKISQSCAQPPQVSVSLSEIQELKLKKIEENK